MEIANPISKSVDHVTVAKMKNGRLNGVMMTLDVAQVVFLISPLHGHFALCKTNVNQEWKVVDVNLIMPEIHEQICVSPKTSVVGHRSVLKMKFILMLLALVMSPTVKDGAVALQDGPHGTQAASVPKDIQD